jgi:hypothetical protein
MTELGSMCDILGHTPTYYQARIAICNSCYQYNKEFERYDDYRDIS